MIVLVYLKLDGTYCDVGFFNIDFYFIVCIIFEIKLFENFIVIISFICICLFVFSMNLL